ncbi:ABC transporter permease [Acuticoccus sediminis]|uniref:ABC transporter permease n=1 Tax=Acuticoccus sediminis TaxID=2184697 RepID=A0A8B2NIM5_9HYPH|nr:ABC transporter permease [Acuticoccus sediminis]RAH97371.1 ABC transporter permease [Acuticoccus sediminis]
MALTERPSLSPFAPMVGVLSRSARLIGANGTTTAGGIIVLLVLAAAVFAPLVAPYDPVQVVIQDKLQPPSALHWLGTDQAGRDIFSRLVWGTRASLTVSLFAVAIGLFCGVVVGLFAAHVSGTLLEQIIMRIIDAIASIPLLIWAIAVIGIVGVAPVMVGPFELRNTHKLMLVIGLLYTPTLARITHAVAQGEMVSEYVKARRVQGASSISIMVGDVLPNSMSPLIVQATLLVAIGIVVEASVSFVGLGVQPPTPSWGAMLADARSYVFSGEWWMPLFPGLAISLTVIGFNLLGDGLRDILDPRRATGGLLQ